MAPMEETWPAPLTSPVSLLLVSHPYLWTSLHLACGGGGLTSLHKTDPSATIVAVARPATMTFSSASTFPLFTQKNGPRKTPFSAMSYFYSFPAIGLSDSSSTKSIRIADSLILRMFK